jgi:hypothetical protein
MSECYQVYLHKERVARKQHKCCECHGTIQVCEIYHYHHGIFDYEPFAYKRCCDCEEIAEEINKDVEHDEDRVCYGQLYEHVAEARPQIMLRFIQNAAARGHPAPQWMIDKCNQLLTDPMNITP